MQKNSLKIVRKIEKSSQKIVLSNSWEKPSKSFLEKEILFFITCQAGLESLVKKEVEKQKIQTISVRDRIIRAKGNEKNMYELLVNSRFANRIYLEITHQKATTFDELFELVKNIAWKNFLPAGISIVTEATAIKSTLSHTPSIQSIAKKAIVTRLTENTNTHHLYENRDGDEAHIQIFLIENQAYILLDITGMALHKRGYRTVSGEAPIKETLAAAMVAFSSWKFGDIFLDPFCGSGTLAIEAAMLARNLAPGLGRHFAVENFPFFSSEMLKTVRDEARKKSYPTWKYKIFAKDINSDMMFMAKDNARRAGVEEDIVFETKDFFEEEITQKTHIVTNPPYGVRLENVNDEDFYKAFIKKMENENVSWGFITSYEESEEFLQKNFWKNRKLYNGGLSARAYFKGK